MPGIRSSPYSLRDPDDDAAFQALIGDVERLKQEIRRGSSYLPFADEEELIAVEESVDESIAALGTMSAQNANAVAITGGSIAGITDLAVADGGTGASTAANARTNLGLGSIATQSANAVAITGGTVSGITSLAFAFSIGSAGTTYITHSGMEYGIAFYDTGDAIGDAEYLHVGKISADPLVLLNTSPRIRFGNGTYGIDMLGSIRMDQGVAVITLVGNNVNINGSGIGFFGATAVSKPTVTGSRAGIAALTSLCTALANLGLITDSTS